MGLIFYILNFILFFIHLNFYRDLPSSKLKAVKKNEFEIFKKEEKKKPDEQPKLLELPKPNYTYLERLKPEKARDKKKSPEKPKIDYKKEEKKKEEKPNEDKKEEKLKTEKKARENKVEKSKKDDKSEELKHEKQKLSSNAPSPAPQPEPSATKKESKSSKESKKLSSSIGSSKRSSSTTYSKKSKNDENSVEESVQDHASTISESYEKSTQRDSEEGDVEQEQEEKDETQEENEDYDEEYDDATTEQNPSETPVSSVAPSSSRNQYNNYQQQPHNRSRNTDASFLSKQNALEDDEEEPSQPLSRRPFQVIRIPEDKPKEETNETSKPSTALENRPADKKPAETAKKPEKEENKTIPVKDPNCECPVCVKEQKLKELGLTDNKITLPEPTPQPSTVTQTAALNKPDSSVQSAQPAAPQPTPANSAPANQSQSEKPQPATTDPSKPQCDCGYF
jgi:hypothetical protein